MIALGTHATDTVTGFDGLVTARTENLYGTPEVCITRKGVNHDGTIWEPFWVPEARCAVRDQGAAS